MKKVMFNLFYISIVLSLLFIGCSKDNSNNPAGPGGGGGGTINGQANITLNGGTFNNQQVVLKNGMGGYSASDTITVIAFSGTLNSDSLLLYIMFSGNQGGVKPWENDNVVWLYQKNSSGYTYYLSDSDGSGSTNISSYGSVGGKIEGSLNGKIVEPVSSDEVTITGNFSATRIPDVN
jgi:hypothetical protein